MEKGLGVLLWNVGFIVLFRMSLRMSVVGLGLGYIRFRLQEYILQFEDLGRFGVPSFHFTI